jgi:hypothetical protein
VSTDTQAPEQPSVPGRRFIDTWKAIAAHVGRSERWCRYTAERDVDPLPVSKFGGMVRLYVDDLDAWAARQRARGLARPVAEAIATP